MTRPDRQFVTIAVRKKTYDRLATAAQRAGEKLGTLLDALIVRWLDDEERKVN